jgi:hypothetical protein
LFYEKSHDLVNEQLGLALNLANVKATLSRRILVEFFQNFDFLSLFQF